MSVIVVAIVLLLMFLWSYFYGNVGATSPNGKFTITVSKPSDFAMFWKDVLHPHTASLKATISLKNNALHRETVIDRPSAGDLFDESLEPLANFWAADSSRFIYIYRLSVSNALYVVAYAIDPSQVHASQIFTAHWASALLMAKASSVDPAEREKAQAIQQMIDEGKVSTYGLDP